MGLKVAIVGLSPSHDLAPFDDDEWEKWGLAWDGHWSKFDRLFEIHTIEDEAWKKRVFEISEYMTVYTQDNYPLDNVIGAIGDYFSSSISYMIGLAIIEGAKEISLYGVDASDYGAYGYQRPNLEYLIGFARGSGIKVNILDDCPLCKYEPSDVNYPERYGYDNQLCNA